MAATVLIIDDERSVREFLRHWLESWGYSVTAAATANEALEIMLADPAPIVLVDIQMPGRDGLWLVEKVRAKWPRTAIIMATGVDDLQTVMKTHRAGVVDYVVKPFGWEVMRQALRRAEAYLSESKAMGDAHPL